MWFSNKMNLFEQAISKTDSKGLPGPYPPKPAKLTPLYSKKRSEISNIDESIFTKNFTGKKETSPHQSKDVSRRSTFKDKLKN